MELQEQKDKFLQYEDKVKQEHQLVLTKIHSVRKSENDALQQKQNKFNTDMKNKNHEIVEKIKTKIVTLVKDTSQIEAKYENESL